MDVIYLQFANGQMYANKDSVLLCKNGNVAHCLYR